MQQKPKPALPDNSEWPEATTQWFEAWRSSPRSDDWDDVQWQYMFATAMVHAEVWGSFNLSMLGELRSREAYMGLNFDKQQQLRKQEAKVTPLDEIRQLYASGARKPRAANKKRA